MLFFDQLKRDDPTLRLVSLSVLAGLAVLLIGFWWVQVVHGREYQSHLETQSFRSIRVPAPRGKIIDRNGVPLADSRPRYNVSLYFEELRKTNDAVYAAEVTATRAGLKMQREAREKQLGRTLTKEELKPFGLSSAQKTQIRQRARFANANALVAEISAKLQIPLSLVASNFARHYETRLALPYTVIENVDPLHIARFEEQFGGMAGVDLQKQTMRYYPFDTTAAHLLGYLRRDNSSTEGEDSFFSYRLEDFRGVIGIEGGLDDDLRGHAGAKSVLVNNLGYKQSENFWQATAPGNNVVLTLDLRLQQAAERALVSHGANTRGAVVVMDTRDGDVLALASSPTYNPNHWINRFPPGEWDRLNDENLQAQVNRATYGNYQPGSIFKIVVALAALENGLDPNKNYMVEPHPADPGHGAYHLGNRFIRDMVQPGSYNFRRAFAKSSNAYFIWAGLNSGVEHIIEIGRRLHLGERCDLPTSQDSKGIFPTAQRIQSRWSAGDTANLCIGQAQIGVTPLQMAVMTSAVANGGTVYWPRLVQRVEPQDPFSTEPPSQIEAGRVWNRLGVSQRTMRVLHDAMLADTEDPDGTGHAAAVPGFRIGGKTGTAQVGNDSNRVVDQITWFVSYGPWESPRYAVVVMVESGSSGGGTCAPIARAIYETIQKIEGQPATLAQANRSN